MARFLSRRASQTLLVLLALFLLGTVSFLWAVRTYFSIDASAIIRPEELGTWEEIQLGVAESSVSWKVRYPYLAKALSLKADEKMPLVAGQQVDFDDAIAKQAAEAAKAAGFGDDGGKGYIPSGRDNTPKKWNPVTDPPEKIPRIIHQTWKSSDLPPQWQAVRDECARMHPDYEYMLWTDADSRNFLVEHYPWFVKTFDAYPYPIQRADAIRYFILHKYGGIYMDLDVGCLRRLDPLLRFEVILPKTIPVGVSNDLMFSAKGHPFMDHLIHNLVTFNHRYLTHYPTVMFSTGPMFVSASYGLYVDAKGGAVSSTPANPSAGFSGIRVLPKPLYGKNAKPSEAPDAFFRHFYGSSWHAGDAGFLIFLREHGRLLIFIGFCLVVYGFLRTFAPRLFVAVGDRNDRNRRSSRRRGGRWISLPFVRDPRSGHYHSLSREAYGPGQMSKSFLDEGTQTGSSPTLASSSEEGIGLSTMPPRTRVAAPQPQRAGLPLFNLGDSENSNGEDDDLGLGLNAERMNRSDSTNGIFSWMNLSRPGTSSSRPASSASETSLPLNSNHAGSRGDQLSRSGSASKSKYKGSGILYLPAFLVGGGGGSSSSDSALASVRAMDDDSLQSPTNSSAYSSGTPSLPTPPWQLTRPHARSTSNVPGAFLSNLAASFMGNGRNGATSKAKANADTLSSDGGESSTLQKMWGGVSLSARTPSPSMLLMPPFGRRRSDERKAHDLESIGNSKSDSNVRIDERGMASSTSSSSHRARVQESSSSNDDDVPPPYESVREIAPRSTAERQDAAPSGDDTIDDSTPTLGPQRKLGRK